MRLFWRRLPFISLLVVAVACKQAPEPAAQSSGTQPTTQSSGTQPAQPIPSTPSVAAATVTGPPPAGGSIVTVEFKDTMTVLLPNSGRNRVVTLTGNKHQHSHHSLVILMSPIQSGDVADLEKIVGKGGLNCDAKRCRIEPTQGIGVEVVDKNGGKLSPALKPSYLFQTIVPSVRDATKNYGSADLDTLDTTLVNDAYPSTADYFSMFFELTGGDLDATPACGTAHFKKVSGTDGPERRFPRSFSLIGTTVAEARVTFVSSAGSKTVSFQDPSFVQLFVYNTPDYPKMNHFEILTDLDKGKKVVLPLIDDTKSCEGEIKADVIGCSASQWP